MIAIAARGWQHRAMRYEPSQRLLRLLDSLVRSGKVRYVGVSNFSAWHLMKTTGVPELLKLIRPDPLYVAAREAEYELVPISIDQGLGILIWNPLAGGLLSGKSRERHGRDVLRALLPLERVPPDS